MFREKQAVSDIHPRRTYGVNEKESVHDAHEPEHQTAGIEHHGGVAIVERVGQRVSHHSIPDYATVHVFCIGVSCKRSDSFSCHVCNRYMPCAYRL